MSHPDRDRRRPRGRKVVLATVLGLFLLALLEAVSYLGWYASEGTAFSFREARRLYAQAASADLEDAGDARTALGRFHEREVIHPFLGYVLDPDLEAGSESTSLFTITPQGFLAVRRPPERLPGPPPLRVGIFGGSMAYLLGFEGRGGIVRGLAAAGIDPPGGVEIVNHALGGMKQPQQATALVWLLANGHHFDAVVLLDGFNEVALASENVEKGMNPYYPSRWRFRLAGLPDTAAQAAAGEILFLRRTRREAAAAFGHGLARHTVTGNLIWRARDRRAARRIAAAQRELSARLAAETDLPFVARGPKIGFRNRQRLFTRLADFWSRSSRQMNALAREHDIAFVHLLQPNQYVPDSKPLTAEERRRAFDPDHPNRAAVVQGWPHLRAAGEALRRHGIPFHDLTEIFVENHESLYIDDCCHVDSRGSDLIGEEIGRLLAAELKRIDRLAEAAGRTSGDRLR